MTAELFAADVVIIPKKKPLLDELTIKAKITQNIIKPKKKPLIQEKKETKQTIKPKTKPEIKVKKKEQDIAKSNISENLQFIIPKKKPVIVKTEITKAKEKSKFYKKKDFDIAKRAIKEMEKRLGHLIGYSDHTTSVTIPLAAVAIGATVIEKHFTISRKNGGVDSQFSLEPSEMKALVIETKRAWQSLGDVQFGPTESEMQSMIFRRSIYFSQDLKKSDVVTKKNTRCVRPGYGLEPKYYDSILGKRVNTNVSKGDPVFLSQFDEF